MHGSSFKLLVGKLIGSTAATCVCSIVAGNGPEPCRLVERSRPTVEYRGCGSGGAGMAEASSILRSRVRSGILIAAELWLSGLWKAFSTCGKRAAASRLSTRAAASAVAASCERPGSWVCWPTRRIVPHGPFTALKRAVAPTNMREAS